MTLIILGLALWIGAHMYKRLAPEPRARLGNAGKGLVALGILAGVALMYLGYKGADFTPVYTPVPGIGHLNNLMMLVAVFFFGIGSSRGTLSDKIRHPMLWGMVIWAVAHLLVNGDLASVILFGGLGLWALVQRALINRAEPDWVPPTPRGRSADIKNAVITVVIFAVIAGIHAWSGHSPFLGTYG